MRSSCSSRSGLFLHWLIQTLTRIPNEKIQPHSVWKQCSCLPISKMVPFGTQFTADGGTSICSRLQRWVSNGTSTGQAHASIEVIENKKIHADPNGITESKKRKRVINNASNLWVLPDRSMATIWKQTDQSSVYDREPVSLIPLYISSTQPVRRVMDSARLLARTNWIFFFFFLFPLSFSSFLCWRTL